MRQYLAITGFLLVCIQASFGQQVTYTDKEFKPLHGLSGLWKMDTQRGALYEEWTVQEDGKLLFHTLLLNQETAIYRYWE